MPETSTGQQEGARPEARAADAGEAPTPFWTPEEISLHGRLLTEAAIRNVGAFFRWFADEAGSAE
jgi:hypothetical protein